MVNPKKLNQRIRKLSGLVGWWPMEESAGTVAQNMAPRYLNTNNGTLSGVQTNQPGIDDRMASTAFAFDGSTSSVVFTGFSVPSTTLTIGFFYKRIGDQDANDRVLDWQDAGPTNGITFVHATGLTNAVQCVVRDGAGATATLNGRVFGSDDWQFFVLTYRENDAKFYQNGEVVASDSVVSLVASSATLTAGRRAGSSANFVRGSIKNLFVMNEVLDGNIIRKLSVQAGL